MHESKVSNENFIQVVKSQNRSKNRKHKSPLQI
jgi:hypothetical protein